MLELLESFLKRHVLILCWFETRERALKCANNSDMFSNLRKYIPNFLSKYYFVGGSRASWAVQMCLPKLTKFKHFPCFTTKFEQQNLTKLKHFPCFTTANSETTAPIVEEL